MMYAASISTVMADLNLAAQANDPINAAGFIFRLILAFGLSQLLYVVYLRCGYVTGSKKALGRNFGLLSMTTMLIINIVKSSLALSLGLVGALSIVRFRTAIKEPEELAYIFICIAIGLGMGAGQSQVTVLGFLVIVLAIGLRSLLSRDKSLDNVNLIVTGLASEDPNLYEELSQFISNRSAGVILKRVNLSQDRFEAAFVIDLKDHNQLSSLISNFRKEYPAMGFDVIENKSLLYG